MSTSISIQPIGLSAIPPVALQLLVTGTSSVASTTFNSASSIVDISGTGLLLSAVSAARDRLQAQQAAPADTSPAGVFATAQGLVDTFNGLQSNVGSLQTLFAGLSGSLLVDQFSLSLNQLATRAIATDSSSFASLQGIGIELEAATPANTAGTPSLRIDQNVLNAAIATDAAGTRALLEQASQSLLAQLIGFEGQAVSATLAQIDLTQLGGPPAQPVDLSTLLGLNTNSTIQGVGVATDLLQVLSADAVLNGVQLSDLDLAALGLDASTILSEQAVRQGSLSADLLVPGTTTANPATEKTVVSVANPLAATATTLPATSAATPSITSRPDVQTLTIQTVPVNNPATAANQPGTTTVAQVNTDAIDAERRASIATLTLQNLVNDPMNRALMNVVDPAYSALIAASHMSDFVLPMSFTDPKRLSADIPAQVLPVARVRATEKLEKNR